MVGQQSELLTEIKHYTEFTKELKPKPGFRNTLTNSISGRVYLECLVLRSNADRLSNEDNNRAIF